MRIAYQPNTIAIISDAALPCDKEEISLAYADGRAKVGSFKGGARANHRSRSECAPCASSQFAYGELSVR